MSTAPAPESTLPQAMECALNSDGVPMTGA